MKAFKQMMSKFVVHTDYKDLCGGTVNGTALIMVQKMKKMLFKVVQFELICLYVSYAYVTQFLRFNKKRFLIKKRYAIK